MPKPTERRRYGFAGGIDGAVANQPHVVVVYIKGKRLIVAEVGDRGDTNSNLLTLEQWVHKIVSEMGYLLVFAGLLHLDMLKTMRTGWEYLAAETALELVWQPEWQG